MPEPSARRVGAWLVLTVAACSSRASVSPDAPAGGPDAEIGDRCAAAPAGETGDGTYYAADGTGNCSFDASPDDLMVAAMNAVDYHDAAWCGACLDVTGPTGEQIVRVVDQCPGCKHGDLDLSQPAFEKVAPLAAGRVTISWHEVECPVTGPIAYQLKDGSSQFYTAIQVRNHRYPIASLEARTGSGAFTAITRASYNYFVVPDGLGVGPYALRVTDDRGHVLEDDQVTLAADQTTAAAAQFPTCP